MKNNPVYHFYSYDVFKERLFEVCKNDKVLYEALLHKLDSLYSEISKNTGLKLVRLEDSDSFILDKKHPAKNILSNMDIIPLLEWNYKHYRMELPTNEPN